MPDETNKPEQAAPQQPAKTDTPPWTPWADVSKDEDLMRMYESFRSGNYMHGGDQIIKDLGNERIAIAFSDPFVSKYWKPVRFTAIITYDEAIQAAKKLLEIVKKGK